MPFKELFKQVRKASYPLQQLDDNQRRKVLLSLRDALLTNAPALLEANRRDLAKMDVENPLYDRLLLTQERIDGIAHDLENVAKLPSPLNRLLQETTLPNKLHLSRVSVPFGVIGVIYEARPNVSVDVFSLCFKSGNACILKGGHDAEESNNAIVAVIKQTLVNHGIDPMSVCLLPPTHEATAALLQATGYVDLCIPRGGSRLISFVRKNAHVPVIETGAGVVNTYFDASGSLEKGRAIILNAKTRRVSVCNALDCLIVHQQRLADLPALCAPLAEKSVSLYADESAYKQLEGHYSAPLLQKATDDSFGTEFMDYKMAIRTVASTEEAIQHIATYGSGHSESIITEDTHQADLFTSRVDAACVYVNAPTSFTDGAQFGLGAEIGISTQKLGPRGPMGLDALTTYKWIIKGDGQVRS